MALSALGRFRRMIPAAPSRRTIRSPSASAAAADAVIARPPLSFPLPLRVSSRLPLREREKQHGPSSRALDHFAGHDQPHDLVGAFENLVDAQIAHDFFDAVFAQIAV